ncbi:MAG: hypothetical protein WDN28_25390 [Chthoniobacter sp.]
MRPLRLRRLVGGRIVFDERKAATNYYDPWYLGALPRPRAASPGGKTTTPAKGLTDCSTMPD